MQKHFIGTQQSALCSVVEFLQQRYQTTGELNLSQVLIVTPGGRAGRRLAERIYRVVDQLGLRYFPPTITTLSGVPERLYEPRRPFASDWIQQLTWSWAIRGLDDDVRRRVFPQVPSDATETWDVKQWLALGRLLQRCYRELAAEGLSFAHVAERGLSLPDFPDAARWRAMAVIQNEYLAQLDQRQLWDRQTARLVAVKQRECHTDLDILLVATADVSAIVRSMLNQVAERVTALIHAPPRWQERFDQMGCLIPEIWQQVQIDLQPHQVTVADRFADQAQAVVARMSQNAEPVNAQPITIGCPDKRLIPHLQRALAAEGLIGRWGPGRNMREAGPYRLLETIENWLRTGRLEGLASLLRHPDVEHWLMQQGVKMGWIAELDSYRSEFLPVHVPDDWLGEAKQHEKLQAASGLLRQLVEKLIGENRSIQDWSVHFSNLLATVYGSCSWNLGDPADRLAAGAARAFHQLLVEQSDLPADIATSLSAAEALTLMLEQIASLDIPEPPDPSAVEILGWLELTLDDSPGMILTGMNEGIVPQSAGADMFLPDSLRQHLGIDDNVRRYARDAYALSLLTASRPQLEIIVGRRDSDGDPMIPSRLLFAADDKKICERWIDFFDSVASADSSSDVAASGMQAASAVPDTPLFRFSIPRPEPLPEPVSRLRVTDFKLYLSCPYRYYLNRVLGLRKSDDESREMDAPAFGNIIHYVLKAFGLGPLRDSRDPLEIGQELRSLLQQEVHGKYGRDLAPAVRVQIKQIELRLRAFAERQAAWAAEGWMIEHVEQPTGDVSAEITVPEGTMMIRGQIDRIDVHRETGQRVILDYKTADKGPSPRDTHLTHDGSWIDLQLPLYRHIARAMGVDQIADVGYVVLPKKVESTGFRLSGWNEQQLGAADETARSVISGVLQQNFWPPGKPLSKLFDDYSVILLDGIPEFQSQPDNAN